MTNDFDYSSVPFNYIHCLHPDCLQSERCLRHLTAQHVPQELTSIMAIPPSNYPQQTQHCPYYMSIEKKRYAWGISVLFDNVPYKKAVLLKRMIHDIYPKTTYYRILHEERPLSPAEQDRIANLFTRHGITEAPVFDRYTDEYEWENHRICKAIDEE